MTSLAQHLVGHPHLLAGLIVAYQQRENLTDAELMSRLGIDDYGLARLILCPRPRPEYTQEDVATIAATAGCDEQVLWSLFQVVADVLTASWDEPPLGTMQTE